MNESTSSRQPKEGREKAQNQNLLSRRSRAFVEEQNVVNPGLIQIPESRSTSGDELEEESPKGGESKAGATANVPVLFKPVVVDLGKDINSLFPASLEEREKQSMPPSRRFEDGSQLTIVAISVLRKARSSTKAKTDERPINFGKVINGVYRSSFPG